MENQVKINRSLVKIEDFNFLFCGSFSLYPPLAILVMLINLRSVIGIVHICQVIAFKGFLISPQNFQPQLWFVGYLEPPVAEIKTILDIFLLLLD